MNWTLDLLPQLRTGTGRTPKDGGCILQVASYLYNREWRDDTPCVHRVLRSAAIRVNDTVDDETRQKLYLLIPRLMNTSIEDETENKRVSVGLAIWCAEQVLHLVKPTRKAVAQKAIQAAKDWFECPCEKHRAAAAAAAYAADAADAAAYAAAAYAAYAVDAAAYAVNAAAYAAYAARRYDLLVGLLDEYDRLTGRTNPTDIPAKEWQQVCQVMAPA